MLPYCWCLSLNAEHCLLIREASKAGILISSFIDALWRFSSSPLKHSGMTVEMRVLMQRSQSTIHFAFTSTLCICSLNECEHEMGDVMWASIESLWPWLAFLSGRKSLRGECGCLEDVFHLQIRKLWWFWLNWETNNHNAYIPHIYVPVDLFSAGWLLITLRKPFERLMRFC